MTYTQAYDKIIQAYFRDEIKPWESEFCFCGTLCDNKPDWNEGTMPNHPKVDFMNYNGIEYQRMEAALLDRIDSDEGYEEYEDELFAGMCNALEVLKQIHRERGEDVDSLPALTKRNLQTL